MPEARAIWAPPTGTSVTGLGGDVATVESRRRIVRGDNPDEPSIRTTFDPDCCWERMNAITSADVTRTGVLSTVSKNTFRSKAWANTVFGRARDRANSRYSSTSGWPTRTPHRSPHRSRDAITHGIQRTTPALSPQPTRRAKITCISCEVECLDCPGTLAEPDRERRPGRRRAFPSTQKCRSVALHRSPSRTLSRGSAGQLAPARQALVPCGTREPHARNSSTILQTLRLQPLFPLWPGGGSSPETR